MNVADIEWLQTEAGGRAAAAAALLVGQPGGELAALRRLGRGHSPEEARAAVALAMGRAAAASKFREGGRLFFDRESAEQASAEPAARWTAARFEGRRVADLGSGGGGDALALAQHAEVVAVDRDAARLAMLRANASVLGLEARVETLEATLDRAFEAARLGKVDAAWLDPSRRDASGRRLDPERWSPSLSEAVRMALEFPGAGIKLAPGIELALLHPEAEVEFVSLDGRLVEAVLWLGELATPRMRRASVLPEGASMARLEGEASLDVPVAAPGAYLYDPDPAIGRAGLVEALAVTLGGWRLDERIAYVASDAALETPFARRFRVLSWAPFAERWLLEALTRLEGGRVEVMRRGSPVDTNALERRLNRRISGAGPVRTVALTRLRGEHIAIVCERER